MAESSSFELKPKGLNNSAAGTGHECQRKPLLLYTGCSKCHVFGCVTNILKSIIFSNNLKAAKKTFIIDGPDNSLRCANIKVV
jgi:hypothetical protein